MYKRQTVYIGPGESRVLNYSFGVPNAATYKLRFILRDDLSGQKTRGGVKKVLDCLDESTTTTTTLPTTTTTNPPLNKIIDPSGSNTRNA